MPIFDGVHMQVKVRYIRPAVEKMGVFAVVTQHSNGGTHFDATYLAHSLIPPAITT